MQSFRNNPDGEENQRSTAQSNREAFALKMMSQPRPRRYFVNPVRSTLRGPSKWVIMDSEDGIEVYDDGRDGNDKPLLFDDEDAAVEFCNRLNETNEYNESF